MELRILILAFFLHLLITVFPARCSDEPKIVGSVRAHLFRPEELGRGETIEINNELNTSKAIVNSGEEDLPFEIEDDEEGLPFEIEDDEGPTPRRKRRQVLNTNLLDLSVSQECDGIKLRWVKPNIPFSTAFHSSNPEFSHYNIYRQTYFFSSVAGLKPIASGKDYPELQNLQLQNWTDKLPPTGMGLFYAVTVVNHKGTETQNVLPKQISFFGTFDNVGGSPVRIVPNFIKGDVLHHDVAYNNFRNEYFVVFDVDQNNDNKAERVYGMRVNGLGLIVGGLILDVTVSIQSTEQSHPSVAFNPSTHEYLIIFQLSSPVIGGGAHVIIGQRVFSDKTARNGNPYLLLNGNGNNGATPVVEPKLIYNSGNGGFTMTSMLLQPTKTAFALFLKNDGKASSIKRLFGGKVLEANLFMDTKHRHTYFAYLIPQWAVKLSGTSHNSNLKHYPYLILVSKADAAGKFFTIGDSVRYLVGYTKEQNANIDGYFDEKNAWLTLFWNNLKNGKKVINSSIVKVAGFIRREMNVHRCSSQIGVQNVAVCFLPNNNAHIMLWEKGNKVDGYLVKDGAFDPVYGNQRRPRVVYNPKENRAFVAYQQVFNGARVVFVRNVAPGSQPICRLGCKSTERCAMKDSCVPRNPVAVINSPTCLKNKGGCSHTCTSLTQGRACSCPATYTLALDGKNCFRTAAKPDVSLLYSSATSIWSVSIYYSEKRVSFARIPIKGQHIIAFFYNAKDKYLYWGDSTERKIYRSHLDGANKQIIVSNQVVLPDGMVVDPVAQHLYWADGTLNTVFRSLLDGANVASFITGVEKPRALVLYQKNKWLFWTNWGSIPKIERINTDGTNRKVLVSTGLTWPNGLTHDGKYLYWADAQTDKIEMSDMNGNGRIIVTSQGVEHPYGLGIAGNRLYWTDWSGHIRSIDKRRAYVQPDEIATGIKKPFSLQIYDGTAVMKASTCPDPGVPQYGGRNPPPTLRGGKYKVGDLVLLTCNPGFVHLGSNSRQCQPTGKWSGSATQCQALPVFTRTPSNKTVDVSFSVSIQCSADSNSGVKATITWYKDGKLLGPSFHYYKDSVSDSLVIPSVVVDDAGWYMCEASNAAGKIQTSMYLHIRQKKIACGKSKFPARGKIIGGARASQVGSIPWQILLADKSTGTPFCGGSLLNERWGVTAAHCLFLKQGKINTVVAVLGEYNWKKQEKTEQKMYISEVHFNPRYNHHAGTYDSDIALFKFTKQAIYTDYVIPVCLAATAADRALSKAGNVATVSGWGARNLKSKRPVKTLHEVGVSTISHNVCKANHAPKYLISSNMLCAGRIDGTGDACQGDSGGPLTVENPATKKTVLIGIVSWGVSCGQKGKYGVYTKVENYLSWINTHIKHV